MPGDRPNPFAETLAALADARVDFVVAGGVAAVLHGVERMTMDVDLAVDLTPANGRRFLAVMQALGMKPRAPVAAESLLSEDDVRAMREEKGALVFTFVHPGDPLRVVDVFLRDDLSYGALATDAETVSIRGRPVRIVSRRRLLEMKRRVQPPRAKDRIDIAELERLERATED